jgi:hypothetical protein
MLIRDTGDWVEFWVKAGRSDTYNIAMPWAYVVNGVSSGWRYYDYKAGSGYEKLGSWKVSYSQTVTFKLGDTGTLGLGGPTTFSHSIKRADKPDPPTGLVVSDVTYNSVYVTFNDGDNNGASIDSRQIGYAVNTFSTSTKATAPQKTISSDRSTLVTDLAPGTEYVFWARTHNSEGWSSWSSSKSATTLSVARINVGGVWKIAVPYVRVGGVWKQAVPWSRSAGVWKEAK